MTPWCKCRNRSRLLLSAAGDKLGAQDPNPHDFEQFCAAPTHPSRHNRGETPFFDARRSAPDGRYRVHDDLSRSAGGHAMTRPAFDKEITALLVIDPYNDFISEGGKVWGRIRAVAEANGCVPHMLQVMSAAREAKLRVFFAMHRRYRPGDYETWKYIAPVQKSAWANRTFE
jgi:hypothetical protein